MNTRMFHAVVAAMVLASWAPMTSSTGTVRVRFLSYDNEDGSGANGECCDGKWGICQAYGCDHVFTICLHNDIYSSDDMYTSADCHYFLERSSEFENMNSIQFDDDINGIRNPIAIQTDRIPEPLSLKVRVEDRDSFNDNELVDTLRLDISQDTMRNTKTPGGQDFTLTERTNLVVNIETVCDPNFYGEHCDVLCIPDTPGSPTHWLCDPETGERYCDEEWAGENCNQPNLPCTMDCQNGGTCEYEGTRMRCACTQYYTGYLCHFNACEDNCRPGGCSYNFLEYPVTYNCVCPDGWQPTVNTNPNSQYHGLEVCVLAPPTTTTTPPPPTTTPTTTTTTAPTTPARTTTASPEPTPDSTAFECEVPTPQPIPPPDSNVFWVERGNADCDTLALSGLDIGSGVYQLHPAQAEPFYAYCDINNRGWTVIQRRVDGTVNFTRGWNDYRWGFGFVGADTNYWLGLENIYYLTNQRDYQLQIKMQKGNGEYVYAVYDQFRIEGSATNYVLHVSGYAGDAGDALMSDVYIENTFHNGMPFSTYDNDNDNSPTVNCAEYYRSPWWNNACYTTTLNGPYTPKTGSRDPLCPDSGCIRWLALEDYYLYSLVYVEMKIRPHLGTENLRGMGMVRMGNEHADVMALELQKQEEQPEPIDKINEEEPIGQLEIQPWDEGFEQELEIEPWEEIHEVGGGRPSDQQMEEPPSPFEQEQQQAQEPIGQEQQGLEFGIDFGQEQQAQELIGQDQQGLEFGVDFGQEQQAQEPVGQEQQGLEFGVDFGQEQQAQEPIGQEQQGLEFGVDFGQEQQAQEQQGWEFGVDWGQEQQAQEQQAQEQQGWEVNFDMGDFSVKG